MGRSRSGEALPIALVGLGKIARDQHLPALQASPAFALAATVDPAGGLPGLTHAPTLDALLEAGTAVRAVAVCTPPQLRFRLAARALEAGLHVLLEKPPAATLGEAEALAALAARRGVSLFAAWHSRFAPAIPQARAWLSGRSARAVRIDWREDVRRWHPGQRWIWEAGGLGVFDPGINALSILTLLVPGPLRLVEAELELPANCETPIAARLALAGPDGLAVEADFDFRQEGPQTWDLAITCQDGTIALREGGARLSWPGQGDEAAPPPGVLEGEYDALYGRFAELIEGGRSELDLAPLRLVADAFLAGRRRSVEPFHD